MAFAEWGLTRDDIGADIDSEVFALIESTGFKMLCGEPLLLRNLTGDPDPGSAGRQDHQPPGELQLCGERNTLVSESLPADLYDQFIPLLDQAAGPLPGEYGADKVLHRQISGHPRHNLHKDRLYLLRHLFNFTDADVSQYRPVNRPVRMDLDGMSRVIEQKRQDSVLSAG